MRIVGNTGTDRVVDLLRPRLRQGSRLDVVSPSFSLFAFAELLDLLSGIEKAQPLLPPAEADLALLGSESDRAARNRLQARWLARRCAQWVTEKVELRQVRAQPPTRGGCVAQFPGTGRAGHPRFLCLQYRRPGYHTRQPTQPDSGVGNSRRSSQAQPVVRYAMGHAVRPTGSAGCLC